MISKDKQYRTRDGREVRIYATDGCDETIHGAVRIDNEWVQFCWMEDGSCDGKGEFHYDLIEVKPHHKQTVWLNVYEGSDHGSYYTAKLDADADAAAKRAMWPRIACIKIDLDFEEGEGL